MKHIKRHFDIIKWATVSIFGIGVAWGVSTSTTKADIAFLNKSVDTLKEESVHHHKDIEDHTIAIKLMQKDIDYIAEGMVALTGRPRRK